MRLKIVTYENLLKGTNKYSAEEIRQIYSNMLDSVLSFIDVFSNQVNEYFGVKDFKSKVYFDDHRAIQAVLEALDDLKRLKDFHPVTNPNKIKYISYLSYWWIQRKPISIDDISIELPEELAVRLYNFNEFLSLIFKLCKCRKTSQPLCHYITNYVVVKTKMYVEDSLDNDIICDFVAIKRLCRHNVS